MLTKTILFGLANALIVVLGYFMPVHVFYKSNAANSAKICQDSCDIFNVESNYKPLLA